MRGMEYVKKVELMYKVSYHTKVYMPYYEFYVELPQEELGTPNNINHYGLYYVPAVEGKYIENMPVYNGEFN